MKDQQVRDKFIELRAQGWSFDRISQEIGVSKPVLISWVRQYKIEINNLKALGLDALCEKFALSRQKRLELLGKLLERVKKEALDRDLSTIPTNKVIELVVKLSDAVKEEGPQVRFQKEEIRTLEDTLKTLNSGRVIATWEG